jgi:uncharacterized membrane protein
MNQKNRVASIDILRGLVMVIMALDHVRDYFHFDAFFFDPLDLEQTNSALFWTRFVTHFCAPVFVFLAGTSAFFVSRRRTKRELSVWLLQRGFWLVVLEFTIVRFGWLFNFGYSQVFAGVIWILGLSMIILAGLVYLPGRLVLAVSALAVVGHNAFDGFTPEGPIASLVWSFLHVRGFIDFAGFKLFSFAYPLMPWPFVMALGFELGRLYSTDVDPAGRRRVLWQVGAACVAVFVLLRLVNVYGDPIPWSVQATPLFTVWSFFNVNKYPPSLLFLLITLGPALIFLAISENWRGRIADWLATVGRVPLFFYVIHIYVIHALGAIAAGATGYGAEGIVIDFWVTEQPELDGYGFNLGVVYLIWVAVVVALYPACAWYDRYKMSHKDNRWLSYL